VLVQSRIGKVAAASTVTTLIDRFDVDTVIFSGVAGGIAPDVRVGDVVVAENLVQHDIDLKGVLGCARFEVPLLGKALLEASPELAAIARLESNEVVRLQCYLEGISEFTNHQPRVHTGIVASGDQFVNDASQREELSRALPGLVCVEMEGAAVAQVCHERSVDFVITRVISDSANEHAPADFGRFLSRVAALASEEIIFRIVDRLARHGARAQGLTET
jgi:adenosylhomocysteine nucleosidase